MGKTIWGLFYVVVKWCGWVVCLSSGGARGGKARLGSDAASLRSKPTNPRRLAVWGLFYVVVKWCGWVVCLSSGRARGGKARLG